MTFPFVININEEIIIQYPNIFKETIFTENHLDKCNTVSMALLHENPSRIKLFSPGKYTLKLSGTLNPNISTFVEISQDARIIYKGKLSHKDHYLPFEIQEINTPISIRQLNQRVFKGFGGGIGTYIRVYCIKKSVLSKDDRVSQRN